MLENLFWICKNGIKLFKKTYMKMRKKIKNFLLILSIILILLGGGGTILFIIKKQLIPAMIGGIIYLIGLFIQEVRK
jgi:hypothetical protein